MYGVGVRPVHLQKRSQLRFRQRIVQLNHITSFLASRWTLWGLPLSKSLKRMSHFQCPVLSVLRTEYLKSCASKGIAFLCKRFVWCSDFQIGSQGSGCAGSTTPPCSPTCQTECTAKPRPLTLICPSRWQWDANRPCGALLMSK